MNSIDLFDYTLTKAPSPAPPPKELPEADAAAGSSSATPTTAAAPEPSLNDEVNQAIGQLGKFWGGFRSGSQSAWGLARKDFGSVVTQARAELGKIAHDVTAAATSPPAVQETRTSMDVDTIPNEGEVKDKGKGKDPSEYPSSSPRSSTDSPTIATGLFARLQSRMPPNLQPSAIAATLSSATSSASAVDIASIRSTLTANIQRAQNSLPLAEAEKLAEGYLHRSQDLFKEAGHFLQDAVKVVPPTLGPDGKPIVDDMPIVSGTDIWLFPSPVGTTGWGGGTTAEKESSATPPLKGSGTSVSLTNRDAMFSQATRSEALLRRLKYDPEMLKLDPSKDESISKDYASFAADAEKQGGIGGDKFMTRIGEVLKAGPSGELDADAKALIDNRDSLVPSEMTNDVFWTRYFFRVHQITSDEEKRKVLLASAQESQVEEHISWDDDDDDDDEPAPVTVTNSTTLAPKTPAPASDQTTPKRVSSNPATQSPAPAQNRDSSDDGSYDVVGVESATGTRGQSPVTGVPAPAPPLVAPAAAAAVAAVVAAKVEKKVEPKKAGEESSEEDEDDDDDDDDDDEDDDEDDSDEDDDEEESDDEEDTQDAKVKDGKDEDEDEENSDWE